MCRGCCMCLFTICGASPRVYNQYPSDESRSSFFIAARDPVARAAAACTTGVQGNTLTPSQLYHVREQPGCGSSSEPRRRDATLDDSVEDTATAVKYPSSTRAAVLETLRDASAAPSRSAAHWPQDSNSNRTRNGPNERTSRSAQSAPGRPSRHRPRSQLWWPAQWFVNI